MTLNTLTHHTLTHHTLTRDAEHPHPTRNAHLSSTSIRSESPGLSRPWAAPTLPSPVSIIEIAICAGASLLGRGVEMMISSRASLLDRGRSRSRWGMGAPPEGPALRAISSELDSISSELGAISSELAADPISSELGARTPARLDLAWPDLAWLGLAWLGLA